MGRKDNPLYKRLDEYHTWLQEEAERQRQRQVPKGQDDPNSEANLDRQLEEWKENARRINGWKK